VSQGWLQPRGFCPAGGGEGDLLPSTPAAVDAAHFIVSLSLPRLSALRRISVSRRSPRAIDESLQQFLHQQQQQQQQQCRQLSSDVV